MKKLEFAAIAMLISVFAHADTETVGDYTWTYRIVDGKAEIYNNGDVAVEPIPTGDLTIPSLLGGRMVVGIGSYALNNCEGLISVTIPNGVEFIGNSAFVACREMVSVDIPNSVSNIGGRAFLECNSLSSVTIPENLTVLEDEVFSGCSSLETIVIPNSITSIDLGAFANCYRIALINIPTSVTNIGEKAFACCHGITNVTVSESVLNVGHGAFSDCSGLMSISVADENTVYMADRGLLLTKDGEVLVAVPGGLENVAIPDGVKSIAEDAVGGNIARVSLPDSLVNIGDSAFASCSYLEEVIVPSGVRVIGDWAFAHCGTLANVVLSNGLECIGDYAFVNCYGLESVAIPSSIVNIGTQAFYGCSNLSLVYLPRSLEGNVDESVFQETSPDLEIIYYDDGQPSVPTFSYTLSDGMATITGASNIQSVLEIPSSIDGYPVVAIGSKAFQGCVSIKEVVISDSVKSIGSYAFQYCSGLERLVCGEDLAEILQWAFGSCVNLRVVKLQDGVQSIGPYAFGFCEDLRQIIIPSSVTNLQWGAFADCAALEVAVIPETIKDTMSKGCFEHIESVPKEYYVGETPQLPRSPEVFAWQCGMSSIRVSWNPVGDNVTGYRVYRSESDYFFGADLVAEITDPEVTSWMDSGVAVGQDYYYWVAAISGLIEGEESDFAIFRIDDPMSLYVDACGGCDENDGLSPDAPLATLGEAICRATPYSTVHVAPGTYIGELYIPFPVEINAAGGVATIDGCGSETCILYNDDWGFPPEEKAVIRGFVLKNGYEAARNVALERCVVAANSAAWYCYDEAYVSQDDWPLGAVLSNCTLARCTVAGNTTIPGKHPLMVDCTVDDATIVWGNGDGADEAIDPVMVSLAKGDCRLRDASPYIINGVVTRGALDDIVTGYVISSVIIGPGALDKSLAVVNPGDNVTFSVVCGSHPLGHFEANGLDGVADGNTYTFSNVQADATLTAVFVSNIVFYVDANNGNDMSDGFSKSTAVATLQTAIDRSADGDTIIVADGVYAPIRTRNRRIVIESESGYKNTVIDGGETNNCVSCVNFGLFPDFFPDTNTVIRGFTLRNGRAIHGAGAVGGTLEYCLITGNVAYNEEPGYDAAFFYGQGGGTYCSTLRRCTVVGNTAEYWPGYYDDDPSASGGEGGGTYGGVIDSCIVTDNEGTISPNVLSSDFSGYNCVGDDPMFSDSAHGDYRLMPNSPCIVNGAVVAGCESEVVSPVPELTAAQVESWISEDLAVRFAKSGESAADYENRFVDKFGSDPVAALNMPTDKKDSQGNDMYVWQDYVAGTDPTDTNSVFTANVEMVDGLPVVTWEPKLSAGEEARRIYTIYGKTNLTDRAWHSPTNEASRFFKVGVEMR